jgi:5-methylcytosine-specific restriction endonuclease McrA
VNGHVITLSDPARFAQAIRGIAYDAHRTLTAVRLSVLSPTADRADVDASDAGDEPSPGDLNMAMVCEHLFEAKPIPARTPGCEECLKTGLRWVHLRLCLSCGHVGCCDSSPGRHATKHFHHTSHPVVASYEPGERWAWCYVDQEALPVPPEAEPYLR